MPVTRDFRETIPFQSRGDGHYHARIDDIELIICVNGYELIVWDDVTDSPCDDEDCRMGVAMEACLEKHGSCPHEFTEQRQIANDYVSLLSGFEEVEAMLRGSLSNSKKYPQPAAARFAKGTWKLLEWSSRCSSIEKGEERE